MNISTTSLSAGRALVTSNLQTHFLNTEKNHYSKELITYILASAVA